MEEETSRCSLRLNENLEKIATVEQSYNENEEGKRIAEQQSFQNEEAAEQMESQLEEARQIAMTSNHKYEDSERKLKIVSKSQMNQKCLNKLLIKDFGLNVKIFNVACHVSVLKIQAEVSTFWAILILL